MHVGQLGLHAHCFERFVNGVAFDEHEVMQDFRIYTTSAAHM